MNYFIGFICGTLFGIASVFLMAVTHASGSQKVCERLTASECELIWVAK